MSGAELLELLRRHEGPMGMPARRPRCGSAPRARPSGTQTAAATSTSRRASASPSVGHANPRVVEAVRAQAGELLHGLGDLHPTAVRIRLAERLA